MLSGPICAMVWEGRDAVKTGRSTFLSGSLSFLDLPIRLIANDWLVQPAILGATNPLASAPGTIRGDYAIDVGRNVCHGSDSVENANKEIALWFTEEQLVSWKSAQAPWVYEKA
jgi:nucleoside-diphosphate kinase